MHAPNHPQGGNHGLGGELALKLDKAARLWPCRDQEAEIPQGIA